MEARWVWWLAAYPGMARSGQAATEFSQAVHKERLMRGVHHASKRRPDGYHGILCPAC